MVWAVREADLSPVFIQEITRDRNGLNCACVCPECGANLQAVNAGRPDEHFLRPGVLRPHFRHHSKPQIETCRSSVARLVALHLLAASDELDLPAPVAKGQPIEGISGGCHIGTATGDRVRARIVSRQWIDRQKAVLHLDNGKTVAVVLVNRTTVDDVRGVDGVLVIEGQDPDVANMAPSDLVRHVQLDGQWLRWARHWEHPRLQAAADDQSRTLADDALDAWPDDLEMPEGLSAMQRSESVLHWALKEALAGMPVLRVPGASGVVHLHDHLGRHHQEPWHVEATTLRITNARLERRLGALVPDIVCSALDPSGVLTHDALLIEVAVTNKVGVDKLRKIMEAGYACIELDASRLAVGGRISRKQLPQILQTGNGMQWLHHPAIRARESDVKSDLASRLLAERQAHEKMLRRSRFLDSSSTERLYQALLACLETDWHEGADTRVRFDEMELTTSLLIAELAKRMPGFAFDPGLMGNNGVLRIMRRWQGAPGWAFRSQDVVSTLRQLQSASTATSRYITVILIAVKVALIKIAETDAAEVQLIRTEVWRRIREGDMAFARPDVFEAFLAYACPPIRGYLRAEALASTVQAKRKSMQAAEWKKRAAEHDRLERERVLAAVEEDRRREAEHRQEVIRKLASGGWQPVLGICQTVEQAKNLTRLVRCHSVDREKIIERAWMAREQGMSVQAFYASLGNLSEMALREVAHVLSEAYLKV